MKTFCRLYYRIPFSETDAMGIVHHSNHARYLERGRVEFLRLVGLDYSGIMKSGFHFPLTEMNVAFKQPLVFDEIIVIEASIASLTKVRLNFEYKIYRADALALPEVSREPLVGKPKVIGQTNHCCVNNAGRPVEMDEKLYAALMALGA